jgi:hypothetical protein
MDELRALILLINTILSNIFFKAQKSSCFSSKQIHLSEERSYTRYQLLRTLTV